MTETTYRIIGFGVTEHGFFNQFNFASTWVSAYNDYGNLIADPEMDGAVLIEVRHEDWRVIEEFGTEGVSISCGPLGTFRVQQASKLEVLCV